MYIPFQQGIVTATLTGGAGSPSFFLQRSGTNVTLNIAGGPVTIIATYGSIDYLLTEYNGYVNGPTTSSVLQWTGLTIGANNYLYWDISTTTGIRTFGITLVTPVVSAAAPVSPVTDQHWFNTTNTTMYVYQGTSWVPKIRVFAALVTDATMIGMAPGGAFIGSQVGLLTPVNAGYIIFSDAGKAIQKTNQTFFTTEDNLFVQGSNVNTITFDTAVATVTATENIAPYQVVKFSDFGVVQHATYTDIGQTALAITTQGILANQSGTVVYEGTIRNQAWNWTGAGVGSNVWIDSTGNLTATDPHLVDPVTYPEGLPPIGRIVDINAITFLPVASSLVITSASGGVVSFNSRSGTVSLLPSDVTSALGFTPYSATNPSHFISANQAITLNGDVLGTGTTTIATTLAPSGVTAGTYPNATVTVDAKGRVTTITGNPSAGTVTNVSASTATTGLTLNVANPTTTPVLTFSAGATGLLPSFGGTGTIVVPTAGQILYSSAGTTYAPTTLTAGSGISITPGAGTLTIAATGGTVTSVSTSTTMSGLTLATTTPSTTPSITLSGTLGYANGGTGLSSIAPADYILGTSHTVPDVLEYKQIIGGTNVTITPGSGSITISTTAGAVAGTNTQVQFNNAGAFGASNRFTWNDATSRLALGDTFNGGDITTAQPNISLYLYNNDTQYSQIQIGSTAGILFSSAGEATWTFQLEPIGGWNINGNVGNTGDVLTSQGSAPPIWQQPLSAPQAPNTFFAGPSGGIQSVTPSWRPIALTDLPVLPLPYDITLSSLGTPPSGSTVFAGFVSPRTVTLSAGLAGSYALTAVASPTAAATINIRKNGTVVGTILIPMGGTSGTFTFASTVTLNPGDVLDLQTGLTFPADIGNIFVTLVGTAQVTV